MRILLVQPVKPSISMGGEEVFLYEPLALEYIAAGVSKDHDVMIFDQRLEKNLLNVIERFNPQIVGITSYSVHVNPVKKLFEQIKTLKPDTLTVVGGHHATIVPEDFLSPSIDLIVMGTHGRRGMKHLFLGSVAEEVVRFAPCPVLTFREQKEPKPDLALENILVPIDFSDHSSD